MPHDLASTASGVCSRPGCAGTTQGRKRSVRSVSTSSNNATSLSNQTAAEICDAYIRNYLNRLPRTSSQRDVHYNGTIDSARSMCIFDVMASGPDVSTLLNRESAAIDACYCLSVDT